MHDQSPMRLPAIEPKSDKARNIGSCLSITTESQHFLGIPSREGLPVQEAWVLIKPPVETALPAIIAK